MFCTVSGALSDYIELEPLATFREAEGLTLLMEKSAAESANIAFESVYRQIILTVHSSLDAVGLTAEISTKLAEKDISANVLAAYYHDHIFVQAENSALKALQEFSTEP
ncbi:ACT domain protein [Grimontia marina]|uniref:ACT domain protein n=1 Tax=Grimontia marina TaxID=646534 RepID=A0A128F339_9GAMM|nr:ACT domain protein [Grimontia marina]